MRENVVAVLPVKFVIAAGWQTWSIIELVDDLPDVVLAFTELACEIPSKAVRIVGGDFSADHAPKSIEQRRLGKLLQ